MLRRYDDNGAFRTTDTPLAAYLYLKDVRLLGIDILENGRGVFLFEQPSENIVEAFRTGKAEASALLYHKSYRSLVRMVNIRKSEVREGR